ncbi:MULTISPECIES: BrnA antitoxin family protein [Burkholderia]|uniref:Antitoxin n=1 Tax=Burkholderia mayonis TaxID=1385591 RepID=A0A1B4FCC0_9BURK|nr:MULTISPECIES: BrnA antitoxin family protein [Burkholderia]AOJ01310.1 antitoxin [Burkholderia mayonis]KVE44712.1 antitoxin [Burkholderia sp. BDU5]KVE46788.1 antitoxin [Burkholderia mayonis]
MSKRKVRNPVDENPEWTDADFVRARPAEEVLTELLGKDVAAKLTKPCGRPKSANPKTPLKLRIDPDIVSAYKAQGEGWQTRMNDALRDYAKSHSMM